MKRLGVVFIVLFFLSACRQDKEWINPSVIDLTEFVYSSVTVQPEGFYKVYSKMPGVIETLYVEENDTVINGQLLAQIDNSTSSLLIENALLKLQSNKDKLDGRATILNDISNRIAMAKMQFSEDSIDYFRQLGLWNKEIGSKAEVEKLKLKYELSKQNLMLLDQEYNRTQNDLKDALKSAENNYNQTKVQVKDYSVHSRKDGKIYAVFKEAGELTTNAEPILAIGDSKKFVIELLIDEVDIVDVRVDQEVFVSLDAYEDTVFKANVDKIYPNKDEKNQTFKVEATFVEQPKVLYPGLSGEANILLSVSKDVLAVPKAYLLDGKFVETDSGKQEIVIGRQNLEFVEVKSGIDQNTKIYKPAE